MSFYIGQGNFDPSLFPATTGFSADISPPGNFLFSFLDTIDGRLFRAGYVLRQTGNRLTLFSPEATEIFDRAARRKIDQVSTIANQNLERLLQPVIGVRRLLELVSGRVQSQNIHFTSRLDKTVCRAEINQYTMDRFNPFFTIQLQSLTGYENEFQILEQQLSAGPVHPAVPVDLLSHLNLLETFHGYYIRPSLDSSLSAGSALRRILQDYLQVILKNRDGVLKNIDTECLHDFRVYLRRSRTLLNLFRQWLPAEKILRAKQDLTDVFRQTNLLRDLDVYLLLEPEYRQMLPETLKAGIDPLFRRLRHQQKTELNRVQQWLAQPETETRLQTWQDFLASGLEFTPEMPETPELLNGLLDKRLRSLIRKGRLMHPETDAVSIHTVRIEAKKLRYFLDAFQPYFEPAASAELLKRLRKMQTSFGDFNDLSIQSRFILETIEKAAGRKTSSAYLAALGALAGIFHLRLSQSRDSLSADFERFDSKESRLIVSTLCGRGDQWQ